MRRRLSTFEISAALLFATALPAPSAFAAPFCLQSQVIPPQCIYDDASDCRRDAGRQGAFCVVNPEEISVNPGVGEYCVVTSTRVSSCVFQSSSDCAREAAHQRGVCVQAPPPAAANTPDPHQYSRSTDELSQGTNRP